MAANEFLPYALAPNANVQSQADYAAAAARTAGVVAGTASSAFHNKSIRQAAFIASMVADFAAEQSGADMRDNGDLPAAKAAFIAALGRLVDGIVGGGNFATLPQLGAEQAARLGADTAEQQARAAADAAEQQARAQADASEAAARAQADAAEANNRYVQDQNILARFGAYAPLSAFGSQKAIPGFQQLPGGIIIQWGQFTTASGLGDYVIFPLAFPAAVYSVVACEGQAGGWGNPPSPSWVGVAPLNNSGFRAYTANVGPDPSSPAYAHPVTVNYIAIGA